ncbi:MAG: hypothetical protein R3F17_08240 [Planctomycetota bacterium]
MSTPGLVSLIHLGCARNLIDSELILARMAEEGLTVTGDADQAQAVVLNTCSFIGPAREESYAAIRSLIERKQRGELGSVVVAGCLVQRYRQKLREEFPEVDLFAEISTTAAWLARCASCRKAGASAITCPARACAPPSATTRACCRPPALTPTCASATVATTSVPSARSLQSADRTVPSARAPCSKKRAN